MSSYWGTTTFSDLAKQAGEAAAAATEVAAAASETATASGTSSWGTSSMFNLDSMQGSGQPQDTAQHRISGSEPTDEELQNNAAGASSLLSPLSEETTPKEDYSSPAAPAAESGISSSIDIVTSNEGEDKKVDDHDAAPVAEPADDGWDDEEDAWSDVDEGKKDADAADVPPPAAEKPATQEAETASHQPQEIFRQAPSEEETASTSKPDEIKTNVEPAVVTVASAAESTNATSAAETKTTEPEKPPTSVVAQKEEPPAIEENPSFESTEEVMARFSEQIRRLEQNHAMEFEEAERRHSQQLQKTQSQHREMIFNEQRKWEQDATQKVTRLENELRQVERAKRELQTRFDSVEQEKSSLQKIVDSRSSDLGKASALHKRDIKILQEQLLEREGKASHAEEEAQKYKKQLDEQTSKMSSLETDNSEMKTRLQTITVELKDRRVEFRDLKTAYDQVMEENETNKEQMETIGLQLSNQTLSRTEKDEQIVVLEKEVETSRTRIAELESKLREQEQKSTKALSDYKRKAQSELSIANSRTASAVQAKEDAELELRAARSTADSAMERSVQAEIVSKEAIATAKAQVKQLEASTAKAVEQEQAATQQLTTAQTELEQVRSELTAARQDRDVLSKQHAESKQVATQEKTRAASMDEELTNVKKQNDNLQENIAHLRDQLEDERVKSQLLREGTVKAKEESTGVENPQVVIDSLQEDLAEANAAISDLKNALMNAVNGTNVAAQPDSLGSTPTGSESPTHRPSFHRSRSNGSENGAGAPLLYAMEKQAELKTAQAEINRLANILSDIQAERTEALEALEETKARLETSESKLERFQKLSKKAVSNGETAASSSKEEDPDSATNQIEYLKNIMISYLNAKTIAEKKALVPVIGAVLCLTPREQETAMKTLESNEAAVAANTMVNSVVSGSFFQSFTS